MKSYSAFLCWVADLQAKSNYRNNLKNCSLIHTNRVSVGNKTSRVLPGTYLSIKAAETLQFVHIWNAIFWLFLLAVISKKESNAAILTSLLSTELNGGPATSSGLTLCLVRCLRSKFTIPFAVLSSLPDITFFLVHLKLKLENLQF